MKGMLGFLAFGVLVVVGFGWYYAKEMAKPSPLLIPFAIGSPKGDALEMHMAVSMVMVNVDPRIVTDERVEPWSEWIDAHFKLKDEKGQSLTLMRNNSSKVIDDRKVGSPEFFLVSKVEPNVNYTLEYLPFRAAGGKLHRYEFVAPPEGEDFARVAMELITN
jgi:hypothetical protein